MKIALLGTGRIGRYHAEVIASVPGIALTVYDVDPAAAAQTAARVGGHAARDVDAALGVADAVVIAAATNVHAELIRRGLQAHLPVFCEKPLAGDLNSTIAVAREVEQTGTPFQLGFQRRFDPAYREARTLVQSGELGTVYAVRLAAHDPAPSHESYIPASGGLFRDFAIHDFDMIRWLTGSDVEEVMRRASAGSRCSRSTATWTREWLRSGWRTGYRRVNRRAPRPAWSTTSGPSCSAPAIA